MIKKGKANVIIDGQWGSSGKGLLAGWLYHTFPSIDAGVCDFMPNAGHTVILDNGEKVISKHVPLAAAYGRLAFIGPHAAIHLPTLRDELEMLRSAADKPGDIFVHPLAAVITEEDRWRESQGMNYLASTMKGGHAATTRKIMREAGFKLAGDCESAFQNLGIQICNTQEAVQTVLARQGTILVETAQGFDLGLNHGTTYPYVTGRDCLVGRALDNAGVPVRDVGCIIGCIRTFPIRVGNTEGGNSGPCYDDQREIDWSEVSTYAGVQVREKTTVTNRTRRVFTFSFQQLRRFLTFVRPDCIFLNFWNYTAAMRKEQRSEWMWKLKSECHRHGCELRLLGVGPKTDQVLDLHDPINSMNDAAQGFPSINETQD